MNFFDQLKYRYLSFNTVERLIAILVVCFIVPFILRTFLFLFSVRFDQFFSWFQLSPTVEDILFQPWTLITYAFFHADFGHIFWELTDPKLQLNIDLLCQIHQKAICLNNLFLTSFHRGGN